MTVTIVGSRSLDMEIPEDLIPKGSANGIDRSARAFARAHRILITEVLPDYEKFGRQAPLRRNDSIIAAADLVIAFWDGKSRGTKYVIDRCHAIGKPIRVIRV